MKTGKTVLYWLPRILGILAILFISLFAMDSFGPRLTFWQQLGGFLMHLIPSFLLLALLLVAWKWEYLGGVLFIIVGLGLSPFVFSWNYRMNHSVWTSLGIIMCITIPFVVVGVLFIVGHFKKSGQDPTKK